MPLTDRFLCLLCSHSHTDEDDHVYGEYRENKSVQISAINIREMTMKLKLVCLKSSQVQKGAKLGNGAFGEVYGGVVNGLPCAIKELDPVKNRIGLEGDSLRHAFLWECARASSVNHPFVLRFLGAVVDGPVPQMVSALCRGGDLEKVIESHPSPLPLTILWRFFLQLCAGVAGLHKHGMAHKDLKTANVLVTSENFAQARAVLADLGTAQVDRHMMGKGETETNEVAQVMLYFDDIHGGMF